LEWGNSNDVISTFKQEMRKLNDVILTFRKQEANSNEVKVIRSLV
jgi:hypothetical protein